LVGESGVKNRALVLEWQAAGVDAMLVGETLMRQPDLTVAVRSLLGLDEPMSNRSLKE